MNSEKPNEFSRAEVLKAMLEYAHSTLDEEASNRQEVFDYIKSHSSFSDSHIEDIIINEQRKRREDAAKESILELISSGERDIIIIKKIRSEFPLSLPESRDLLEEIKKHGKFPDKEYK